MEEEIVCEEDDEREECEDEYFEIDCPECEDEETTDETDPNAEEESELGEEQGEEEPQ